MNIKLVFSLINSKIIETLSNFFENVQLEDLRIIIKVAELRSVTAAADHFNIRPATASAAIKRVENII